MNILCIFSPDVAVYEEPMVPAQEEGSDLSVVLVVDANPSPDTFTWLKDGEELTMDGRVSFDVTSINITGLIRDDAGIYAVRATNIAGTGPQWSFEVDVLCKLNTWQRQGHYRMRIDFDLRRAILNSLRRMRHLCYAFMDNYTPLVLDMST